MARTADADGVLTVYSDYVCPFCYLGKHALEEYLAGTTDPPAVEYHPFDLWGHERGPDGTIRDVDDGKDEAYYRRARENVERLVEEYDVDLDGSDARSATADPEFEAAVRETFESARTAGVTGVPTFVYGDHAARGAVPPDHLRRLVGERRRRRT